MSKVTIWIDADACPKAIKEIVYRTSFRLQLQIKLVTNSYMTVPQHPLIQLVQIDQRDDIADQYIMDNCVPSDIVVTHDIPLAALAIKKGACAINSRGKLYTEDNVYERLATRNLMKELRNSGVETCGPAPFNTKNIEHFANSLKKLLTNLLK